MSSNIVVYGIGRGYLRRKEIIDNSPYNIVEFWDNNPKIESINGIKVVKPHRDIAISKIIITSNRYYSEIFNMLTKDMGFNESVIEKYSWFEKQIILDKYKNSEISL